MKDRPIRFGVAVVAALIRACVAINVVGVLHYRSYYRQAFSAYQNSRADPRWPVDSFEFITRGVQCGASETEVDTIMHDAMVKSVRQPDTVAGGTIKYYLISYQPEYKIPFGSKPQPIIMEQFFVRFDDQGRACELERILLSSDNAGETRKSKWNLCDKKRIGE